MKRTKGVVTILPGELAQILVVLLVPEPGPAELTKEEIEELEIITQVDLIASYFAAQQ